MELADSNRERGHGRQRYGVTIKITAAVVFMINNTLAYSRWQEMMGLSFIAQKSTSQNQSTMIYLLSLFVLAFGCSIFRVLYVL